MRPSLRQLDYLIALQKSGSFNAAADMMYVTQSTLSAGIKELEDVLGHKVAVRDKRRVTLTPFGADIAARARSVLGDVDALVARAHDMQKPLTGPIRLGIIPTIAPYILPRILPMLQREFPKLELQVFEDLSARIVTDLRAEQLDAIILALPYPLTGLEQQTLWRENFVYATTTMPRKKLLSLDDLKGEKLLLLADGHCLRDHALQACHLPAPATHKTFSATSLPTLIQMVANGYGATLLPEMVAETDLPDGIVTVPFKTPKPTRDIGMAWRGDHAKVGDFDILAKTMKAVYT